MSYSGHAKFRNVLSILPGSNASLMKFRIVWVIIVIRGLVAIDVQRELVNGLVDCFEILVGFSCGLEY